MYGSEISSSKKKKETNFWSQHDDGCRHQPQSNIPSGYIIHTQYMLASILLCDCVNKEASLKTR